MPTASKRMATAAHVAHSAGALTRAAQAGHSGHILLMQSPAMGLTHDWLTRLIGCQPRAGVRPTIGCTSQRRSRRPVVGKSAMIS